MSVDRTTSDTVAHSDVPASALQKEIDLTRKERDSRSVLRRGIDGLTDWYSHSDDAFHRLQSLAGNSQPNSINGAEVTKAIEANQTARQREQDAYSITSGAAKMLSTFLPGRAGFLLAAGTFGLDEVKAKDPNFSDAFLGLTKGMLSRSVAKRLVKSDWNPATMSLTLGPSSRLIDSALSSDTYADGFTSGVANAFERTFNPQALAVDLATAGVSYPILKGTQRFFPSNPFRAVATTSFLTGYANGMVQEVSREQAQGQYSWERLAYYPLIAGTSSMITTLPAAQRQYVRQYPSMMESVNREKEYQLVSIDSADVQRIGASKGPVTVSVKPMTDYQSDDRSGNPGLKQLKTLEVGPSQQIEVVNQKVPVDWLTRVAYAFRRGSSQPIGEQFRFISRMPGNPAAPWEMVVRPEYKTASSILTPDKYDRDIGAVGKLMTRFGEPIAGWLGSGSQSYGLLTASGNVMKVSRSSYDDRIADWGHSPFDAKLLYPLTKIGAIGHERWWVYLQEHVKTVERESIPEALAKEMPSQQWVFSDYNKRLGDDQVSYAVDQVGINALGKTVMIDYGARTAFWVHPVYGMGAKYQDGDQSQVWHPHPNQSK